MTPAVTSPDSAITVFDAIPAYGPTDERTGDLVRSVRAQLPAGAELTGGTAFFADISRMLAGRLWLVIAFVVAVSVLLLAMVFRSVVIPLKAAVMNLLSIGAAYGVLTAVFQWGWATDLLGLDHPLAVSSWVPILMFAILFGLSMDYEVFLLSRIREDWARTGDSHGSVVRGLSATGRVISSAAAIMVAVFLGFASEVDVVVKQLGVGMAARSCWTRPSSGWSWSRPPCRCSATGTGGSRAGSTASCRTSAPEVRGRRRRLLGHWPTCGRPARARRHRRDLGTTSSSRRPADHPLNPLT